MTTVQVAHKTPAGVDGFGTPIAASTTTTTVTGTMDPQVPEESAAPSDGAVVRYILRCPIDTVIARGDSVTWRGHTYRVRTVPLTYEDPWAGPKVEGLEVHLQRVEADR